MAQDDAKFTTEGGALAFPDEMRVYEGETELVRFLPQCFTVERTIRPEVARYMWKIMDEMLKGGRHV